MLGFLREMGEVVRQAIRYQRVANSYEDRPGEMRDALMLAITGMGTSLHDSAELRIRGRITPLYRSDDEPDRKAA